MRCLSVGGLGDEGPADEIFEALLRHRPRSISKWSTAFHAKQRFADVGDAGQQDTRKQPQTLLATINQDAGLCSEKRTNRKLPKTLVTTENRGIASSILALAVA
jgi:hypothetical protein